MTSLELFVEGAVLGVAAVSAARIFLKRPARRELRSRPVLAAAFALVALTGLSGAIWLAVEFPLVRRLGVAALAAGMVIAAVRARPRYGRRRGLPPGSLGLAESLDAIEDPDYYARASDRWGPVFKMSQIHQPVACITDLETGFALFREQADRLRQSDWAFNRLVPGGYLEYMDGERHERLREMLVAGFTSEAVAAARPAIAGEARARLAAMARASEPDGVHPEPYLLPISHAGLIRMVLGISPGHDEFAALRARFVDLNRPLDLFLPIPRASRDAYEELTETVSRLARTASGDAERAEAAERRDRREPDTYAGIDVDAGHAVNRAGIESPSVLHHLAAASPSIATDPTAIGNLVLMVKEGGIMTRGMLRWVIAMLADHPEEAARLRKVANDPAELDARATAFALETIRRFESPYLYRRVAEDVEVGGYRVPKGWLVRLCLTEAHARPEVFADPGRFDPGRFRNGSGVETHFRPFGAGSRACPGRDIALEIAKTVVREAALAYDIRAVDDGPAWRINRHWGLWRPSLGLRVRLERHPSV